MRVRAEDRVIKPNKSTSKQKQKKGRYKKTCIVVITYPDQIFIPITKTTMQGKIHDKDHIFIPTTKATHGKIHNDKDESNDERSSPKTMTQAATLQKAKVKVKARIQATIKTKMKDNLLLSTTLSVL